MDFASVAGLLMGLAAIALGQHLEGGGLATLVQPTAAAIVLGGTAGATLLSLPGADLRRGLAMLSGVFRRAEDREVQLLQSLTRFAQIARKEGIIAVDDHLKHASDAFLRSAVQHVVDGTPSPVVRDLLQAQVEARYERARAGIGLYETAGGYAPTLGIVGAVLGLIHVMESLDDPSRLGAGIAVAFVATVYGVGLANLVLLPIAARLRRLAARERACEEMIIEGALAIEGGHGPRIVEERLQALLSAR